MLQFLTSTMQILLHECRRHIHVHNYINNVHIYICIYMCMHIDTKYTYLDTYTQVHTHKYIAKPGHVYLKHV